VADPVAVEPLPFRPAEPFRFVVEEGKVHEFARATGSRCADHLRALDPVSPVTFLMASALWMAEENSAWRGITRDVRNRLHGEQEFTFGADGPPVAGTELTGHQFIGDRYAKAGRRGGTMTFTWVVTRFWPAGSTSDTEPAVELRSLSINTSQPPPGAPGSAEPDPDLPVPAGAYVAPPLTINDFVRYQGASGDFNPIHHDPAVARAGGFPGPFAVGMLPAAVAANLLSARYGSRALRRYRARWSAQAWPGDALRYLESPDGSGVRMTVTRPNGATHLTAWAELAP
jgi:acyl dehydratase